MTPPDTSPDEDAVPDGAEVRADAVLTRLGLTTPRRRDVALAGATAVVSVAVVLVGLADPALAVVLGGGPLTVSAVLMLLVLQSGVLVVRRTRPVLCLAVTIALQVVQAVVLPTAGLRGPAPVVAAYTCGTRLPARRALTLTGAAALVEAVAFVAPTGATGVGAVLTQLASSVITYLAASVVGGWIATRRHVAELARWRAAEALEAQRARADAAVGAERTRVARELHDIAAHHLAAMVVQASVAERLVDRDPDAARRTITEIRTQGRATLHDLRLVVGALRERGGGVPEEGAPMPGLATLERLVADAGPLVGLEVVGAPRELSPVADVSVYRVAQEALSNARDHAPGARVTVRVRHGETATVLEVGNGPGDAPAVEDAPGRGLGLIGMRERAELIGADLEVGPSPDGGWRVRLELPRDAA
ncbi:sensor histidine kinase [Actinomycetospora rhizophila]|uniref:histidine kinase n=1 Tax=Actinomycetospora rhizophila TaxID=1416876 RepID=A0ABV9Z736_9PSEU